jgi:hypothetical protein
VIWIGRSSLIGTVVKIVPKSVADLVDDPFRSRAGELRRVAGSAGLERVLGSSVGALLPQAILLLMSTRLQGRNWTPHMASVILPARKKIGDG